MQQSFRCLHYVEEVVKLSKLQHSRVCPGHRGSGTPFTMVLKHDVVKPPRRSHEWTPSTNQLSGPHRGFVSRENKRLCVNDIKNTYLKSSYHHTDTTTVVLTHQVQPRHVSVQWVRTIRLLAPVRGLTRPSIPPPFHGHQETCSQTFPPRAMDFVFFSGAGVFTTKTTCSPHVHAQRHTRAQAS